jgi:hypothetical protein
MNIGLQNAKGAYVLFLNGGDVFEDKHSLSNAMSIVKDEKCYLFRTKQIWLNDAYIRPSENSLNKLFRKPAHQGFISPLNQSTPPFDESRAINADMIWMKGCIELFGYSTSKYILSKFYLGGVSNYPTLRTIATRYKSGGLKRAILESIKYCMRIILRDKHYYRIMAHSKGYEKIK